MISGHMSRNTRKTSQRKENIMYYIIYFIGFVIYLVKAIGTDKIYNFMDRNTMGFVLLPCLFILLCTKSFPAFGRAFLFAFGKRGYSLSQHKSCLQAVRMMCLTAVGFGLLCFTISMVNCFLSPYNAELSSVPGDYLCYIHSSVAVALLAPFYALHICLLLLPISFMLKQHIIAQEAAAPGRKGLLKPGNADRQAPEGKPNTP